MTLQDLLVRTDLPRDLLDELGNVFDDHDRLVADAEILRAVLDSMSEGVVVSDRDGNFVMFNSEAERLLGAGAVNGGPDTWAEAYGVFRPDGETAFPADEFPLVLAARGINTDGVEQLIRNAHNPEGRIIRVSGRPWRGPDGEILGGVVVFRDVTGQKSAWSKLERRVEERTRELEQTQEQLVQAQKLESLGQLCGGIAHDFNNVLTAITGYTEILLGQDRLCDADRRAVQEIHRAGARAAQLTRQLLAFSRKQPLQPRAVDVNAQISGLEQLLRRLIGEPIDVRLSLDPALPPAHADAGQVEQIILNLAVNARDAMPHGGSLTIETGSARLTGAPGRRHFGAAPGDYVEIAVTDVGIGMEPATLARVFEPFFTTKEAGHGTGLGLSTVYGIVQQSRGDIWVCSEPGQGTTFKVYLPVSEGRVDEGDEVAQTVPVAKPGETVLVAEDEEAVRNLVRQMLEAFGYRVLEGADGDAALKVGESHPGPIHLLLTDSVMPRTSGHALATRLLGARPETRVLYMSGYPERALTVNGHVDEETAFLAKPFTPLALARKVREVLDAPDP